MALFLEMSERANGNAVALPGQCIYIVGNFA